jgi:hypothetical protein
MIAKERFSRGIVLKADDVALEGIEGEIKVGLTSKSLHAYLDGALRTVVSTDQVQALTNKTIDADLNTIPNLEVDNLKAGVLNTSTSLASASDTQIPSALAVKTLSDDHTSGASAHHTAAVIDNVPSGNLAATDVQAALNELQSDIDTRTLQTDFSAHIADAVDAHDASAISNVPSGNLAATDVQGALNELQGDVDQLFQDQQAETIGRFNADTTLQSNINAHLNDTIDAHDASAISTTAVTGVAGGLASDVQTVIADLKNQIDTKISTTPLNDHINDTTDAHDASAISLGVIPDFSAVDVQEGVEDLVDRIANHATGIGYRHTAANIDNVPSGNLAATNVQTALNELQSDIDTRALQSSLTATNTAISDHLADTVDAHDASAISNIPAGNLAATDVQAALNELQSDIDTRALQSTVAAGAASSTDNAIPRFDGTTGKILQGSNVIISDADALTGASSILSSGNITSQSGTIEGSQIVEHVTTDSTTTGANALVTATTGVIRLTNASLTSVSAINNVVDGQSITLINATGHSITVVNDGGASASSLKIYTGTGADVTLANKSSLLLKYNTGESRWLVIGGTGSGSGGTTTAGAPGDVDVLLTQNFDTAVLGDFTQTGLTLDSSAPLNGAKSAKLTHQAATSQSFKQTIVVPLKFRGAAMTVALTAKSTATSGNVTILFRDETNNVDLQSSQQIAATSTTQTFQYGVTIPSTCTSFSYTITALQEAGSPVTYIDDVVIRNYWLGTAVQGQTQYNYKVPAMTEWATYAPTITGFNGTSHTDTTGRWRRVGDSMEIEIYHQVTGGGSGGSAVNYSLPAGYSIDSTKHTNGGTVGSAETYNIEGASAFHPAGLIISGNTLAVLDTGGSGFYTGAMFGVGAQARLHAMVPILGWTSHETKSFTTTDLVPAKAMMGSASIDVPNGTVWTSYTPVIGGCTAGSVSFKWRQVLDTYQVVGTFEANSPTASPISFSLPNSGSIDANKIASLGGLSSLQGDIQSTNASGGASVFGAATGFKPLADSSDYTKVFITNSISTDAGSTVLSAKLNGSVAFNPGSNVAISFTVPVAGLSATTTKTWSPTQQGLIQEADSTVELAGASGWGSTNASIRRFTTPVNQKGSDIIYIDDPANGASFTAVSSGIYQASYSDLSQTTAAFIAIVKNQLNGAASNNLLASSQPLGTAGGLLNCSWQGYLNAGDIIRLTGTNGTLASTNSYAHATVTKQGSLKQLNVNSEQKATIPTHLIRMEGSTGKGSGSETSTVQFTTLAKIRGDGLSVDNSNGTKVTVNKKGILHVNASYYTGVVNGRVYITKNWANRPSEPLASEVMSGTYQASVSAPIAAASFDVVPGDVIRIYNDVAIASAVMNTATFILQEQEVQVSVSNTLPQFSESDLLVRCSGNANQAVTANATDIPFAIVSDTNGSWSGSAFTVPTGASGVYYFAGSIYRSTASQPRISVYVNGVQYRNVTSLTPSDTVIAFSFTDSFTEGQVISLRTDGSFTLSNSPAFHWLNITKQGKPNVTGVNVTPFINVPQPQRQNISVLGNPGSTIIIDGFAGEWEFTVGAFKNSGDALISIVDDATNALTKFVATKKVYVSASFSSQIASVGNQVNIYKNGSIVSLGNHISTANYASSASADITLEAGEYISFGSSGTYYSSGFVSVQITATAAADQILTAPETFSTDTTPLTYSSSYTLSTLANAPVGTYITFQHLSASSNARTQTSSAPPTQTSSSMSSDGILVTAKSSFAATTTSAAPSYFVINIGKGHKGVSISAFKNTGKSGPVSYAYADLASTKYGTWTFYDESKGLLYIDAGYQVDSTLHYAALDTVNDLSIAAAYFVINASKNPALTGMNIDSVLARYAQNSGQSIAHGTDTTVLFNAKTYDSQNAYNTSIGIYTVAVSGKYLIEAQVAYLNTSDAVGTSYQLGIRKNGAPVKTYDLRAETTTSLGLRTLPVVTTIDLVKGDQIHFVTSQNSGVTRSFYTDPNYNSFSITKVGN